MSGPLDTLFCTTLIYTKNGVILFLKAQHDGWNCIMSMRDCRLLPSYWWKDGESQQPPAFSRGRWIDPHGKIIGTIRK
jgi:hypothetical protein